MSNYVLPTRIVLLNLVMYAAAAPLTVRYWGEHGALWRVAAVLFSACTLPLAVLCVIILANRAFRWAMKCREH